MPYLAKPTLLLTWQVDLRYQEVKGWNDTMWEAMVNDPRVAHVWVSHLDVAPSPRVSPLPVGLNPREFRSEDAVWSKQSKPPARIMDRPLKVLVCGRLHAEHGQQFATRRRVHDICTSSWAGVCDAKAVPARSFVSAIRRYPFLVCAHGGGLDPSPKAWTALISGVIPIMRRHPALEALYHGLPVVFVEGWGDDAITPEKLRRWREELAPHFEELSLWARVVEKTTDGYWWKLVAASYYTGRGYSFIRQDGGSTRRHSMAV
jgi:hypothetical protein